MGNSLLLVLIGILLLYFVYNGKLGIILDVAINTDKYKGVLPQQ